MDPLDQEKDIWHEDYVKSSLTSLALGEIQDKIPYPLLSPAQCCDSSLFFFFTSHSVCHTTRLPRKKEENLEDYCFVTQEQFEQGVVMVG